MRNSCLRTKSIGGGKPIVRMVIFNFDGHFEGAKVRKVRGALGARVSREVCHAYRYLEHEVQGNIGIIRQLQTFRLTNRLPSLYSLYGSL